MSVFKKVVYVFLAVSSLMICGCAGLSYEDDSYSDMPWARSQEWESSGYFPGMSNGY